MPIPASDPVIAPAVGSITYNQWTMTQMIVKSTGTTCPCIIHLHRSAVDANGNTVLMPNGPGAEISFTLDIFQQAVAFPVIGTAMQSVTDAVVAYATAKKLL